MLDIRNSLVPLLYTTLVKRLAIRFANEGTRVPVFIQMQRYQRQSDLQNLFTSSVQEKTLLEELLKSNKLLIIFDGLNEVSLRFQEGATRAIGQFISDHPKNQFFITCRTAGYPKHLRQYGVQEFEILRMTPDVQREYLTHTLGPEHGARVYSNLPSQVRELCLNPLLLWMLTYLQEKDKPVQVPTSKVELYANFLSKLYKRDEDKLSRDLTQSEQEMFLTYLASKMENKEIAVRRDDAERWILDCYSSKLPPEGWGRDILKIRHELLVSPPLTTSEPGNAGDVAVSFMHQSFLEYYTAKDIQLKLENGEMTLENVIKYTTPSNEHWWETLILLAGMLDKDKATEFIAKIKEEAERLAKSDKNQKTFVLAARCINGAKDVDPVEVDDVIARTLLTFKFGDIPFDYDLIHGLKLIKPEQRSKAFPERLNQDVDWWLDKYARASGTSLGRKLSIQTLLAYLDTEDEALLLDTLFTLRGHVARGQALQKLRERLDNTVGVVREQVIVTLGYLETDARPAIDILINIVEDTTETEWARSSAVGALGRIGDKRAVPTLIAFMLDHSNTYRDSASWALQGIAKKNKDDEDLYELLRRNYAKALLSEICDIKGRYAKGNIVYSLGELESCSFVEKIITWLEGEEEPYVIEDGIQALGKLRDMRALPIVLRHLKNEDFVVRAIAIEAAKNIALLHTNAKVDVLADLRSLLNDEATLVKERASSAISALEQ